MVFSGIGYSSLRERGVRFKARAGGGLCLVSHRKTTKIPRGCENEVASLNSCLTFR